MRVDLDVLYNNAMFTGQAGADIESITYTDNAAGESDSVEVVLDAQDEKWLWDWMPEKGASLELRIRGYNWDALHDDHALECGLFVVDEIDYSDTPAALRVSGVSKPGDTGFSEAERAAVWQNTSLRRIGETICARYGLGFTFDADDHDIDCDEQDGTDGAYYKELCERYGLSLKIYAKRLWVYDRETYKEKPEAVVFDRTKLLRGSLAYRTELAGTFTGGTYSYTDPATGRDIVCSIGGGARMKHVNRRAANVHDAAVQLCAELNEANHGKTTLNFSTDGVWNVCAGNTVRLTGYGKLDGRYFVDSITHKVSRSGGYTADFSCSAVLPAFRYWEIGGTIEQQEAQSGRMTDPARKAAQKNAAASVQFDPITGLPRITAQEK